MKSVIAISMVTLFNCAAFAGTTQVGSAGGPMDLESIKSCRGADEQKLLSSRDYREIELAKNTTATGARVFIASVDEYSDKADQRERDNLTKVITSSKSCEEIHHKLAVRFKTDAPKEEARFFANLKKTLPKTKSKLSEMGFTTASRDLNEKYLLLNMTVGLSGLGRYFGNYDRPTIYPAAYAAYCQDLKEKRQEILSLHFVKHFEYLHANNQLSKEDLVQNLEYLDSEPEAASYSFGSQLERSEIPDVIEIKNQLNTALAPLNAERNRRYSQLTSQQLESALVKFMAQEELKSWSKELDRK